MYKRQVYECSLPADEIQESGGFSQLEEYGWEVPVRNGNGEIVVVASVKKLDGKWELVSYRQAQEEEIQAISGDGVEKQLERERSLQKAEISARKTVFLDRYAITEMCIRDSPGAVPGRSGQWPAPSGSFPRPAPAL